MIELVSVEVLNFRSFSHATLAPLGVGQGMTAINGANGSGKSSLVAAITWAMFGLTPDGVPVKALRRQGSEGEVRATVVFRHQGETVTVTRALRGRNDTTVAAITVDEVEQTTVSSRTATAWVMARLGLDAEAFLTAFVVRQKELDSLVRARPAERRKTIERLAGIERMSAALDLARQDARAAQRLLGALPEAEDPAVAAEALTTQEARLTSAADAGRRAEESAQEATSAAATADRTLMTARRLLNDLTQAQHATEIALGQRERAQHEVNRLSEAACGADDLPHMQAAAEGAREARSEAEQALRSVAAIVERAEADAKHASAAEAEAVRLAGTLAAAETARTEGEHALAGFPHDLDQAHRAASRRASDIADSRGAVRGEWERLRKAINTLREAAVSNGHAQCPTCEHVLEDPEGLLGTLSTALLSVESRGKELDERFEEAKSEVEHLQSRLTERARVRERLQAATEEQERSAAAAERAEEQAARSAETAETSAEEAHEATLAAREAERDLPRLRQEEQAAQGALRKAETAAQAAADLAPAQEALDVALDRLQVAEATSQAASGAASGVDVDALDAEARLCSAAAQKATQDASEAATAHALALRDTEAARASLDRAIKASEARRDALRESERTSAVASALEEFRRDRLARLAPELSEVASDFVARMTDGRFTALELDEEFTPILTEASGAQRPAAWLSGGEESAVALSLRIAIGEVLAGQRGGLLVLDEVLTAQDQARRQATMAAIRALPRQVITINHVSEATDMVDLVAEVVPDEEGGSTIVESVPADALGSDLDAALS